jgi:preprotein translocase subunit SecB
MVFPSSMWRKEDNAGVHIIVEGIFLASLDFELNFENLTNLDYELNAECQSHYPEPDKLVQIIDFEVTHEIEDPALWLGFTFVTHFRKIGDGQPSLQEFAKANAPAYVMPYARELIANITSRSGILPTLVIPPINIFSLIEKGLHDTDELTLDFDEDSPASDEDGE